jgi:hypothetical protein
MAEENNNIEQKISLTYDTNAQETAKEVGTLNTAIDNTTQSQNENTVATDKSTQNLKTFKTQLREANQELLKVSQTFGETSKEAVQAAKKVADLKDQMQFSKDLVDNFNPDQKFKALGAATQIATTATSGLVSGMALFGDQSEDTQKALLKVQAAMAFSDAVSGLSNLGDQWKTLKTVIASSTVVTAANTAATTVATAATKLFGVTAETTAVGFKVLRGAIIATGIGALGIAIVALVQNFDSIKKAILNTIPGLSSVADTIGNIVQSVTDFVGATSEADRQLDLAKSKAKAQLEANKKYLQEHESQLNEVTKKKIEAKNKYLEVVAEEGKATAEFARETNRQIAKADAEAQAEKEKKEEEAAEKLRQKRKEQRAKDLAEQQKYLQDQKNNEIALQDEITKAIETAQDKNNESLMTAQQVEERAVNDKYFRLIELAKQQHKDTTDLEIAQANEINDIRLKSQEQSYADQKAIDEKKLADKKSDADKQIEIEEEIQRQKEVISKANFNLADKAANLLTQLAGKNKALQKAGIIAQAGIGIFSVIKDTQAANAAAVAPPPIGLGPVAGIGLQTKNTIGAALSIASITAASAKALSALGGGGSAGGGASMGSGGGASATPTVGFQTSAENQIATTISNNQNQQQPVVKAFVVSSEVSTAQAIDRNKVTANSFGN